jgi:hypothetical protein
MLPRDVAPEEDPQYGDTVVGLGPLLGTAAVRSR